MATNPPCDICQTNPTDLLITNVHNGDTLGLCMEDIPVWAEVVTQQANAAAEWLAEEAATNGQLEPEKAPKAAKSTKAAKAVKKAPPRAKAPEPPPEDPGAAEGGPEGSWTEDAEGFAEPVKG